MQVVFGQKKERLFKEFIEKYFPSDIHNYVYVEPFGGSFSVSTFLKNKPNKLIYNDIVDYDLSIIADEIHHSDYLDILSKYDSENTFFYLDPPYFGKEKFYGKEKNDIQFHTDLFNSLKKIKGKFVMSYEENKFIRELWKGHNIFKYDGDYPVFKHEILIVK